MDPPKLSTTEVKETRDRLDRAEKLVRETLKQREKAEYLTLDWIEKLLDPVDSTTLKHAARFLRPQDYDEVIVERNLSNDCGYPICERKREAAKGKYKIAMKDKKIYSLEKLSMYCSFDHLKDSVFFRSQLSDEPIWTRDYTTTQLGKGKWESNIKLFGEEDVQETLPSAALLDEVCDLKTDRDIVEHADPGNVQDEFPIDAHESIEGFVSRFTDLALQSFSRKTASHTEL